MPRYDPAFRRNIVEKARKASTSHDLHSIADGYGVPVRTLRGWITADALVRGENPTDSTTSTRARRDPADYTVDARRRNSRRSHPPEIREEALRRLTEDGERPVDISRDLIERGHSVSWRTIYSWREQQRRSNKG